jgi:hypothetical protein
MRLAAFWIRKSKVKIDLGFQIMPQGKAWEGFKAQRTHVREQLKPFHNTAMGY